MEISTIKFGKINIDDDKVIMFDNGILGFEDNKKFVLFSLNNNQKFYWLQSVDNPDLAIACMDPLNICDNYSPKIDENILKNLQIENDDILVLCVVVIPSDVTKATVNLAAPIIINTEGQKAMQVVLQNDQYETRHLVFK